MARIALINSRPQWGSVLRAGLQDRAHSVLSLDLSTIGSPIRERDADVVVAAVGVGEGAVGDVVDLRAGTDAAIIAVVRDGDFLTRVSVYEAGADDCVVEPIAVDRLIDGVERLARARATDGLLNENGRAPGAAIRDQPEATALLPIERRILAALVHSADSRGARQGLVEDIWGLGRSDEEPVLRLYLHLLRNKLPPAPVARPDNVRDTRVDLR